MEMFMSQSWFQIVGEVVLMFTALTGAMPDRFVNKIPVLGKLWPIFNWLAGNVFNNVNHPKGMAALREVEDELDKAKAEVRDRVKLPDVLDGV
jgi:hypothetical protein|tara:strand:- start:2264 stop:2542 length:279 start_codon:yes stop_codon:yes gene_type:complete